MKIFANQLPQQLKKPLALNWLVFGDEPLQKIESIDAIRQEAARQGFDERIILTVDQGFDWSSLEHAYNELSLFSNQKIIELELPTGKPGQTGSKVLAQLCQNQNPDILLIVHGNKIGLDVQKAKWFKSLDQNGVFLPCYPIEGVHFSKWIKQRCLQAQINITPDAMNLLSESAEGNLLAASQEIEKLSLLNLPHAIDEKVLESMMLDQSRFNVFQLVDAALKGDSKKTVNILNRLKAEDIEPNIVLWALQKEIMQLDKITQMLNAGENQASVYKQLGIWKNRIPLFSAALSRLNRETIIQLVIDITDIEQKLKSFTLPHPFTAFATICLAITQPNALSKTFK